MERKHYDREDPDSQSADREQAGSAMDHREGPSRLLGDSSSMEGGSSTMESMTSDRGYTDEGGAKDFKRQGDGTDFARKSHSSTHGSGRYVGMAKIARQVGMDVQQLRSCAQSQGIVPDRQLRSCDMFSQDKANQIMQACGTGFNAT
jgi:hypothetical protein